VILIDILMMKLSFGSWKGEEKPPPLFFYKQTLGLLLVPLLYTRKKGFVIPTKLFVKIGITKIFCYSNKMFGSINKTFGCYGKIFGCSNKNFIYCP